VYFDTHILGALSITIMTDVGRLRDSTQILLPESAIEGLEEEVESRFVVTVRSEQRRVRIIGSPVEIKDVSDFLTRNGVAVA
jgi:hypothetical protein